MSLPRFGPGLRQPPDATDEEIRERYLAGIGIDGSSDAYDGQNEPQKRELTARERDVLCGLIADQVSKYRETGNCHHLRGGVDWLDHLIAIREVISPRVD